MNETGARSSRATWLTALAAVVVVGLVVALVVVWRSGEADDASTDPEAMQIAESEATQVASDIAVAMTTYDHRTVEEDFAWVDQDGTDTFEDTFAETTRPLQGLIKKTKARAEGTVTDAAGTAEDADHVRVLLFVDQVIVRGIDRRRSGESSRVVMQMVREGDRWLVDDVDLR